MRASGAKGALLILALALSGCLTTHPRVGTPEAGPVFRPEVFFDGHTRGVGTLSVRFKSPELVRVESVGAMQPDGTFRLDQTITIGSDDPETRTWIMTPDGPNRYTSTLSDASGDPEITVEGSALTIRYLLAKPAIRMEQRLVLEPDGQAALNLATVRAYGIPIARLSEHITRHGAPER